METTVYRAIKGLSSYVDNCLSCNQRSHVLCRQLFIGQPKVSPLMETTANSTIKGLTSHVDNCLLGKLKYNLSCRQLLIV